MQVARPNNPPSNGEKVYEYDDEDEDDEASTRSALPSNLQSTQTIVHIPVNKPGGTVRLERVLDTTNAAARLAHPLEVVVVPCPTAEFSPETVADTNVRCAGQDKDLKLEIDIVGVPPLSLRWYKEVNGKREHFLVEGIEGTNRAQETHAEVDGHTKKITRAVERVSVPLTASLDVRGTYTYILEEVIDGVGNAVSIAPPASHQHGVNGPSSRFVAVLRRPSMSFKHCAPGLPASILIGGETSLSIATVDADGLDAPWEVSLRFKPSSDADNNSAAGKKMKAYTKKINTVDTRREVSLRANSPGEYIITGVKGRVRFDFYMVSRR